MPTAPTKQPVRYGVANLFDETATREELVQLILRKSFQFSSHPFSLPIKFSRAFGSRPILLVGDPGSTSLSVDAMKTALRSAIASRTDPCQDREPIHLRIIRAETLVGTDGKQEIKHNLWFEVAWRGYTCICGGCNDFSGTGGNGGTKLEQMFMSLADMDDIFLEEITIPLEQAKPFCKSIFAAFDAFLREKKVA